MERALTIEDFRAWGKVGGNKRIENAGGPDSLAVKRQAIKANRASVKARRLAKRLKAKLARTHI